MLYNTYIIQHGCHTLVSQRSQEELYELVRSIGSGSFGQALLSEPVLLYVIICICISLSLYIYLYIYIYRYVMICLLAIYGYTYSPAPTSRKRGVAARRFR